jgi:putative transport protein
MTFPHLFTVGTAGYSIVLLTLTAGLGLLLGEVRFRGAGLGIAGTLFAGLAVGHFGGALDASVVDFVREFGLILFVYTIGMQVGPGFLDSLKRQGVALNGLAVGIVAAGVALACAVHLWGGVPAEAAVGILSGASTNTPSLGAAQQTLAVIPGLTAAVRELPGIACAVTYPFAVVGVILILFVLRLIFRLSPSDEAEKFLREVSESARHVEGWSVIVESAEMDNRRLGDLAAGIAQELVITRLLHDGEIHLATPDDVLRRGDVLLVVGPRTRLDAFTATVGRKSDTDLRVHPGNLITRNVLVTNRAVTGFSLKALSLQERFGVVVSRVFRGDIVFTGTPEFRLNFGDRLLIVGTEADVESAARAIGDSAKALERPHLLAVFVGILLGVIVGTIPLPIPGLPAPLRLGLAGGPMVTAIALSYLGRLGRLNFYISHSANLMLRELGIVLFLSCVGLGAGEHFVEVLVSGPGWSWMAWGAMITIVPPLTAGVFARKFLKMNYMSVCGLLSGAMTNPPALAFSNTLAASDAPSVAYATVYPLTMILRVLSAQVFLLFFLR